LKYFKTLGNLVAKSILDQRIIDLKLSSVFWDLVLDRYVDISKLNGIDTGQYKVIMSLIKLVNEYKAVLSDKSIDK